MMNETIPAAEGGSSISKPVSQMGEHTPGPWHVREPFNPSVAGETYSIRHHRRDRTRWNGYVADVQCNSPKAAANARLIAAATDMLAALIASEAEYENLEADAPVDSGCPECTLNTVPANLDTGLCAHHMRRAAIAKATGTP